MALAADAFHRSDQLVDRCRDILLRYADITDTGSGQDLATKMRFADQMRSVAQSSERNASVMAQAASRTRADLAIARRRFDLADERIAQEKQTVSRRLDATNPDLARNLKRGLRT